MTDQTSDDVVDAEVVGDDQQTGQAMQPAAPAGAMATRGELSVEDLIAQAQKVQAIAEQAMVEGDHYGTIPGTDKPTLLKPGAEKLCLTFRLDPEYEARETFHDDGHYTVTSTCTLYFIPTGTRVASGMGSCSTRESKYAYRNANRVCPSCGGEAIIKGKREYGGGWLCWKKRSGCGAKYDDGDQAIESQEAGRVPNPDLGDLFNTVLKMANKRALVAAVLNGTAASDIFTQDIGDTETGSAGPEAGETVTNVERRGPEPCSDETWESIKAASAELSDDGKQQVRDWCAEHGWTLRRSELSEPQARQVFHKILDVVPEGSPAEASGDDKPHDTADGEASRHPEDTRCAAITQSGDQCSRAATPGSEHCVQHTDRLGTTATGESIDSLDSPPGSNWCRHCGHSRGTHSKPGNACDGIHAGDNGGEVPDSPCRCEQFAPLDGDPFVASDRCVECGNTGADGELVAQENGSLLCRDREACIQRADF